MIDIDALTGKLLALDLAEWREPVATLIRQRLAPGGHGDFAKWQRAIDALEHADGKDERRKLLLKLAPWRKGPFELAGVRIDAEWRSDLKWSRVCDGILPLDGRHILDVGCGNGYYALQMADAGAASVIGVDPTILYVMQFTAVNRFALRDNVFIVPARLEELPLPAPRFDTSFSMGVLYHQRSPLDHLMQLRQTLRPGGQLVLETIYLPGEQARAATPPDRYARMRNVWLLPTIAELRTWLSRTGFRDIAIVDQSLTSVDEQQSTDWMTFESLREALDPDDSSQTIEGWPAPHRLVVTAIAP